MFLWPCIVSKARRKNTNKMQQYDLLSILDVDYWLLSRHVSGIFMPIIRRKDHVLLNMWFLLVVLDVAGCGAVVLRCRVWTLWRLLLAAATFTVLIPYNVAPQGRGVNRVLVGKPEGKRPLGKPRCRWEDNIRMDLREVGGGVDWMELAQDRDRWRALVNTVMNLRVP